MAVRERRVRVRLRNFMFMVLLIRMKRIAACYRFEMMGEERNRRESLAFLYTSFGGF